MSRSLSFLALVVVLSGCGEGRSRAVVPPPDPAVAKALIAPVLADPDLVSIDRRFAIADPVPVDAALPPDDFSPATIVAARAEARALTGGARVWPPASGGACVSCDAPFVDERAALLGLPCSGKLRPGLAWSLQLALPVYPKSHLHDAAGGDDPACAVRAATFSAPVPADEVLRFYAAVATREGFALAPAGHGSFAGRRGPDRLAVTVRPLPGGFAQYDLIATRRRP